MTLGQGIWPFQGGVDKVDEGDSLNTAIRETREEVGLLLNKK